MPKPHTLNPRLEVQEVAQLNNDTEPMTMQT